MYPTDTPSEPCWRHVPPLWLPLATSPLSKVDLTDIMGELSSVRAQTQCLYQPMFLTAECRNQGCCFRHSSQEKWSCVFSPSDVISTVQVRTSLTVNVKFSYTMGESKSLFNHIPYPSFVARCMSEVRNKLSVSFKGLAVSRRGVAFLGVLGLGGASLSYGVYKSSQFFSQLTHRDSARIGIYLGGVGTAVGVALTGRVYRLFTLPSVDKLVSDVMVLLRGNSEVRQHVGTTLRTGQFRAYAYGGGTALQSPVSKERWIPRWPVATSPKNLQVMFQLLGDKSTGMVSLRVDRRPLFSRGRGRGRGITYSSLAVDFKNGERLIISGEPNQVIFQGYTRLR